MHADRSVLLSRISRRASFAALLTMLAFAPLLSGCSGGAVAPPVDPNRAREALNTTLESWKKGQKIDDLKSSSPPIVAQDFDWMAGAKLVSFEITGDGKDDNANLRIPVKLTLQTADGKQLQKTVSYVVGTSPSLTVFREML